MVSGLVTSPELQERICLLEARPISIASKLFMSIKVNPYGLKYRGAGWRRGAASSRRVFGGGHTRDEAHSAAMPRLLPELLRRRRRESPRRASGPRWS